MTVADDPRYDRLKDKLVELREIQGAIGQIQVTSDIPTTAVAMASGAPAQVGGDGRAAVGPVVHQALANSLGWSWKPRDTGGFLAALRSGWTIGESAGIRTVDRTDVGTAFAHDLGALSGAQAIIFADVNDAAQKIVPELKALEPLKVAPDLERVEAIRSIVVAEVEDLADGFAKSDGPILQRVDELWDSLIGDPETSNPEEPDELAHLGQMKLEFGFDRGHVNSVEQELVLSRWLAVVSRLTSLRDVYIFQRPYLAGSDGYEPYLGTQFVVISRALEVLRTSVREFKAALQAHFIDEAEMDGLMLHVPVPDDPVRTERLFLGALMGWAERYPAEASDILRDAGKAGVRSIIAPLEQLARSVEAARPEKVVGFPFLYTSSPIIASTQASFEGSIYETLALLYPLDQPTVYEESTGAGDGGEDLGLDPNLGRNPVDGWHPVHISGPSAGIWMYGTGFLEDFTVSLRRPDASEPEDITPEIVVEENGRLAVIPIEEFSAGPWIVEAHQGGRTFVLGTIVIHDPPETQQPPKPRARRRTDRGAS